MKISEVSVYDLKEYSKETDSEPEIIRTFAIILAGAKAYIKGYTGLTDDQLDTFEDLTIVLFVLSNEMYENRQYTVQDDKVNKVVKSILDMHCVNLL